MHVASEIALRHMGAPGIRILDVWQSLEAGQRFMDERLMPIIERMAAADAGRGEFTPPTAEYWYELHDVMS